MVSLFSIARRRAVADDEAMGEPTFGPIEIGWIFPLTGDAQTARFETLARGVDIVGEQSLLGIDELRSSEPVRWIGEQERRARPDGAGDAGEHASGIRNVLEQPGRDRAVEPC